jgi:outer membrane immunogenic protein
MFKKILAASALSLLPTLALAADLPRRSMALAPSPVAAPLFTWTGFYAGANAGYGWGETRFGRTYSGKTDVDGPTVGAQLGYNHQVGMVVMGVEGDLGWANVKGASTCTAGGASPSCASSADWLGTARARAGLAANNILFYGTAGLALGGIKTTGSSDVRTGWTAGAGVEYGVDSKWSVKAEYIYQDFGKNAYDIGVNSVSARSTIGAAKIGVNYRFGGLSASRF